MRLGRGSHGCGGWVPAPPGAQGLSAQLCLRLRLPLPLPALLASAWSAAHSEADVLREEAAAQGAPAASPTHLGRSPVDF